MAIDRTWYNALVDDSGAGLDGTVWTKAQVNSLLNLFDNRPRAKVFHSTTQSLTSAVVTALNFNSEDLDIGGLHDPAVNNSRLTIPTGFGGVYLIIGKVAYAANATGVRVARIHKNGALIDTEPIHAGTASGTQVVMVNSILALAAGDYIELVGYQDSGAPLNTGDAASRVIQNELQIVQLI